MAEVTQRSTGNRRAVRNAQFRRLLDEAHRRAHRKLREGDLYRISTTFGPPPDFSITAGKIAPTEIAYIPEPLPHPLVRWWRRLLWGE